jgi:wobble nucleotide-excising tRNase
VFDDPVSSLDSDILHIVSSLIRGLFEDVCAGNGVIKQVFVMTHNIAFHKEVTFFRKQQKGVSPNQLTFWRIYKRNEVSEIIFCRTNPVKSSYELLWAEIANRKCNSNTIQNTLRRILEQASKLLGGIDPKKLEKKFTGTELTACRTLMAWVNDGSHFCHDDLYVTVDDSTIDIYLNVFKRIFEQCGWAAHYLMMMEMEAELSEEPTEDESGAENLVRAK